MDWLKELMQNNGEQQDGGNGGATVIDAPPVIDNQNDEKVEPPKDYHVLIHNDDVTPFEVVVEVLATVFSMPKNRAMAVMLAAHNSGKAIVATYSKDMAETKADQAMEMARKEVNSVTGQQVPLTFSVEEA